MDKKKRPRTDKEYGYNVPYQHPGYTASGPQYDNAVYFGDDPRHKSFTDDRVGFPIGPFQSLPRPPRMYPAHYKYKDDSQTTLKDTESIKKNRKRTFLVIGAVVIGVLVTGAIIGSVLAATLTGSASEEPRTQQVQVIKSVYGEVTMTDKTFTEELNDPNSATYKQTAQDFENRIDQSFANNDNKHLDGYAYNGTTVNRFRNGSVIVEFESRLILIVTVNAQAANANSGAVDTQVDIDLPVVAADVVQIISNGQGLGPVQIGRTDHCESSPCENGARCSSSVNTYRCTCAPGYSGRNCQNDINECDSSPCQHGGQCTDQIATYRCTCVTGFSGDNCEINIDDCENAQCINYVRCDDSVADFSCVCSPGWTGKLCEYDVDECASSPCRNGAPCTDLTNAYSCACQAGFSGDRCEINIDDCESNPCENGGFCTDGINSYTCTCVPGFTDENCERNIDDCECDPCLNGGSCTDGINDYTCSCKDGYTGDDCEQNIDDCECDPCLNGGSCTDGINDYTCSCKDGYTGDDCEQNIDDCANNPCQNGGICTDGVNTYTCRCMDGFTGNNCEDDIDDCATDPCQNGGSCTDGFNSYTCRCMDGFTGFNCEDNIDDCETNPCQNGGSCTDGINSHTCICDTGFTGSNCDQSISASTTSPTGVTPSSSSPSPACPYQFECNDGACIPLSMICDDWPDCSEAEDEQDAFCGSSTPTATTTTLPTTAEPTACPNQFQCNDGDCIPLWWICDDWPDCLEGEDEQDAFCDCEGEKCTNRQGCFTEEQYCDGVQQCSDGSDELGCPLVCSDDEFSCVRTYSCVSMDKKCDGVDDCGDNSDEIFGCPDNSNNNPNPVPEALELQLVTPGNMSKRSTHMYGRVEIRAAGTDDEWGTVCHDMWDDRDAAVVCRMMGFDGGAAYGYRNAVFGEGEGAVLMTNVRCNGDETSLLECPSFKWGEAHCRHSHDASVSCGEDMFPDQTTTAEPVVPTPPSDTGIIPPSRTRLVGGSSCLEGRLEVYGGPPGLEHWGNVCDDFFDLRDAYVACRSLGFRTFDGFGVFPYGAMPIVMDDLFCEGDEANLHECKYNGWGVHDCMIHESVQLICSGIRSIDCEDDSKAPSVACDFEHGLCGYSIATSGETQHWHPLELNDNTYLVYNDAYGKEGDSSRIQSPVFNNNFTVPMDRQKRSTGESTLKLEFNYNIRQSSYGNLKVYLVDDDTSNEELIWQSVYLGSDEEYKILYACVEFEHTSDTQYLVFEGTKGPSYTVVELDNIVAAEGNCVQSLLDESCTFDHPSTCGLTVECGGCQRGDRLFRWWWTEDDYENPIMTTDSSFGQVNDEAWMSFAVPNLNDIKSINFDLQMFGENIGSLAVYLYDEGDRDTEIWRKDVGYSENGYIRTCITLPNTVRSDVAYIKFKAILGLNGTQDISIDNVELSDKPCIYRVACQEDEELCGWTVETEDKEMLTWTNIVIIASPNLRLVGGPSKYAGQVEIFHEDQWGAICDDAFSRADAIVVCRTLGFETKGADYKCCSRFGTSPTDHIWLDELNCDGTEESITNCTSNVWGEHDCYPSEHVGVVCAGPHIASGIENGLSLWNDGGQRGNMTSLVSPEVHYNGGEYKLLFKTVGVDDVMLKVWYQNLDTEEEVSLGVVRERQSEETFCAEIPTSLKAYIQLGITAVVVSPEGVSAFLYDITIEPGTCTGNLAQYDCSFESLYTGCAYSVEQAENQCDSSTYMWRPIDSRNDTVFRGVSEGRYLHISNAYGQENDASTVTFTPISQQESIDSCSLHFSYIRTGDGDLQVSVNSIIESLPAFPVPAWQTHYIDLPVGCGTVGAELIVGFTATGTTAAIDDVYLSPESTPSYPDQVSCTFDGSNKCGYMTGGKWKHNEDGWLNSSSNPSVLVSPEFTIPAGGACLVYTVNTTGNATRLDLTVTLIDNDGETIQSQEWNRNYLRQIVDIDVESEMPNSILIIRSEYDDSNYDGHSVAIDHVTFYSESCDMLDLPCAIDEWKCPTSGQCVKKDKLCDGFIDCIDGMDELDETTCKPNVTCTFKESMCGYIIYGGHRSQENGVEINRNFGTIESPLMIIDEESCLAVTIVDEDLVGYIRIILNREDTYSTILNTIRNDEYNVYGVTLPIGTYSALIEIQSRDKSGNVIIHDISVSPGQCELETSISTTPTTEISSTTTSAPLTTSTQSIVPNEGPYMSVSSEVTVEPDATAELICEVYDHLSEPLYMSWWLTNGTQISYVDDIVLDAATKYSIEMENTRDEVVYKLFVNNVREQDTDVGYMCKASIPDIAGTVLTETTYISLSDDGCVENPFPACERFGFGRLMWVESMTGMVTGEDAVDASQMLRYNASSPEYCNRALMKLACGLHTTQCIDSQPGPQVCRNSCEDIARRCRDVYPIVYGNNTDIDHYCKFLPYYSTEVACEYITEECGTTILMEALSSDDMNLLSKYYPSPNLESSCHYRINASRGYYMEITFNDILGLDCNAGDGIELVDPEGQDPSQSVCLLPSEPIVFEGKSLDIKMHSENGAFNITIKKVLPEQVCYVYDVYKMYHNQDLPSHVITSNDVSESCSSWILLTNEPYNISVEIMTITGECLRFLDDEGQLLHEECVETSLTYSNFVRLVMVQGTIFSLNFTLDQSDDSAYTITDVDIVGGDGDGDGVVVITRSDGVSGSICFSPSSDRAADLLCNAVGFSYAQNIYTDIRPSDMISVMFILSCGPDVDSIDECGILWYDSCSFCYCAHSSAAALTCAPFSESCEFYRSDCGYTLAGDVYFELYGGIHMLTDQDSSGSATSPIFTYGGRSTVHFMYIMSEEVGSHLSLSLTYAAGSILLWTKPSYMVMGEFQGCVDLPGGLEDVDVQLVFSFTRGFSHYNVTRVLTDVTLSKEECPGIFPDDPCSFTNLDVCSPILDTLCTHQGNTAIVLRDGSLYGDSFAIGNVDAEHPFTLDVSSSRGESLFYSFSSKASIFKVIFMSDGIEAMELMVEDETQGRVITGCVGIPYRSDTEAANTAASVSFVLTPGSLGGDFTLDDFHISDERCPHYASCAFEKDCGYEFDSDIWTVEEAIYLEDNTYHKRGKGHYLTSSGSLDWMNINNSLSLPAIELDETYQCLSLYYRTQTYGVVPEIYASLSSSSDTHEYILPALDSYVTVALYNEWFQVQIPLGQVGNVGDTVNVTFGARKKHTSSLSEVNIDDITILPHQCATGLDKLGTCNFEHPILCIYETSGDDNSGYHWERHRGPLSTEEDGIDSDADFDNEGAYMIVDSSLGGKGQVSVLSFDVDLAPTLPASVVFYRFMYYRTTAESGTLMTHYTAMLTGTSSDTTMLQSTSNGTWQRSPCFQIPQDLYGPISIKAQRGQSHFGNIAVDNVEILRGRCSSPTMACGFNDDDCGFIYDPDRWSIGSSGFHASEASELFFPLDSRPLAPGSSNAVSGCARITFTSDSDLPLLVNVTDSDGSTVVHKFVSSNSIKIGSVNIPSSAVRVGLRTPRATTTILYSVTFSESPCQPLECESPTFFQCNDQCLPSEKMCDGSDDCYPPTDEESCGYSLACDFATDDSQCGYVDDQQFQNSWTVKENLQVETLQINETLVPVNGHMIVTEFRSGRSLPSMSVLRSSRVTLNTETCVTFSYAGVAPKLTVQATYWGDSVQPVAWTDPVPDLSPTSWRPGRLSLPAGTVQLSFIASASNHVLPYLFLFVAIDDIQTSNTPCADQSALACPVDYPYACESSDFCISEEQVCDRRQHCSDNSDELEAECIADIGINCDFEQSTLCGYTLHGIVKQRPGFIHSIPPYDHTYQNVSGHYLYFSVWHYNDVNNLQSYVGRVVSPAEMFDSDGCITFWYLLNSTDRQPKALTAQLFASVNGEVLWYDNVDRVIPTWIQGNVAVPGGVSIVLTFDLISSTSFTAYPGIIALDDVFFEQGPCLVEQVCKNRYECAESGVCIPFTWLCDGITDCLQGDDENSCDRDNGLFQMEGGAVSYGQLRYFFNGGWRAVCFPPTGDDVSVAEINDDSITTEFDLTVTRKVCESLGYSGYYESFQYHLLDKPIMSYSLTCEGESCLATPDNCTQGSLKSYAGVRCSNSECFSGEVLCPGTLMECIPERFFCNGFPDCSNNRDELDCYCGVDDDVGRCDIPAYKCDEKTNPCELCSEDRQNFKCLNHECIDRELRCNGEPDCSDSSDEYQCVLLLADKTARIFDAESLSMKGICLDGIGLQEANILCQISGQGYVANGGIQHGLEIIRDGLMLSSSNEDGVDLGNGLYQIQRNVVCFPLVLECAMPACGSTKFMDELISPFIIHGDDVVLGALPYQGLLIRDDSALCGLTYLGGNWALTAGHCVLSNGDYTVAFGILRKEKIFTQPYAQSIPVLNIYTKYDGTIANGNDIALLRLAYPPDVNDYIRSICLGTPESFQDILDLGDDAECIISGYGSDEFFIYEDNARDQLRKTEVGILSREECVSVWGANDILDDDICIINARPLGSACYGDSGGPLACKNKEGYWEQFGVTSYGKALCFRDSPDMYASVPYHRDWLDEIMNS